MKALFASKCIDCGFLVPPMLREAQEAIMEAHIEDFHPDKLEQYRESCKRRHPVEDSL